VTFEHDHRFVEMVGDLARREHERSADSLSLPVRSGATPSAESIEIVEAAPAHR